MEMAPYSVVGASGVNPQPIMSGLELHRTVDAVWLDCCKLKYIDDGGKNEHQCIRVTV
jgi:hypothetical protein